VQYAYHAGGLLASAEQGDAAQALYFGAGRHAKVTNRVAAAGGGTTAMLSPLRYVDDGTEQLLLRPRKDVQGVYAPAGDSVSGYDSGPYGAEPGATPASAADLADNPFRFAGEYRDPAWGGVYLRGRWYNPGLAGFVSRDPRPNLNRFGYAGGNPVMHIDPAGFGFFHALGGLMHGIERDAGKLYGALNKGWMGNFDRFFLAPLMGSLSIIADPKAFWQSVRTDKDGVDLFMVLSAASGEGFGMLSEMYPTRSISIFWGRVGTSATLSLASATAVGADRGFRHFSWSGFRNGLEGGLGNVFDFNIVGGQGYNRFNLTGKELADGMALLRDEPEGQAFIFRRATPQQGLFGEDVPVHTSPLKEWLRIGSYHEQLVAVTADGLYLTELADEGTRMVRLQADPQTLRPMLEQLNHGQFELVGLSDRFDPDATDVADIGARVSREQSSVRWRSPRTWRGLANASQRHAALVLQSPGMR
jgi:RHS repeat-associated protein